MKNPSTTYNTYSTSGLQPKNLLKIGEAAKILGVSIDTLRRWEKSGKIKAQRTPGGTRLYSLSALKKVNPASVADFHAKSQTTEELLRRTNDQSTSKVARLPSLHSGISGQGSDSFKVNYEFETLPQSGTIARNDVFKKSFITKFLISSAVLSFVTLLLTAWIAASYWTNPKETSQFFKNNIASGILSPFHFLAGETIAVIDPKKARELGFVPPDDPPPLVVAQKLNKSSNVLAVTSTSRFLEVNSDTQILGSLFVRDSLNGLSLEATPSANSFVLTSGDTQLTVTNTAKLDQDVSTVATPTFNTLNLSGTKDQLIFQSGGPTGTLTWTPTAARVITLPDVTTTLAGTDNAQTLTNKSLSGSSNTFSSIPNSALSNNKVTVASGTNLTGGGDVNLGSSITLALKASPSITGTLTVAGATILSSDSLSIGGVDYTYPTTQGAANTVQINDGAGALTWTSLATAGGWTVSGNYTYLTNASGNVGIGTATPSYQLQTTGNVGIGASATVTSTLTAGSVKSNGALVVDGSSFLQALTATTFNGNTWTPGTGTLTLTNTLATSGNYSLTLTTTDTTNVTLPTTGTLSTLAGTENLSNKTFTGNTYFPGLGIWDSNGNVGIGTTDPSYQLQTTGNVGIGQSLTVSSNTSLNTLGVSGTSIFSSSVFLSALSAETGSGLCINASNQLVTCTVGAGGASATNGFVGGVAFFDTASDITANPNFFWDNSTNRLGIGTSAPSYQLQTTGNIGIGASATVTSTLTAGSVKSNGALVVDGSSFLQALTATTFNGNTWTPGTGTLTLAAGKTLTANNSITLAGTDSTTMTFPATSTTVAGLGIDQTFTGVNTFNGNLLFGGSTGILASGGNVGIGTTNPTSGKLEILSSTGTGIYVDETSSNGGYGIYAHVGVSGAAQNATGVLGVGQAEGAGTGNLRGGHFYTSYWGSGTATNAYGVYIEGSVASAKATNYYGLYLDSSDDGIDNNYAIYANGSNKSYFGGNVGIGATTSSNKLDVWGNAAITGNLTLTGSLLPASNDIYDLGSDTARWANVYVGPSTLHIGTSTSDEYAVAYDTAGNRLGFNVNGSGPAEIVMDSSGNLGIGTTNPASPLEMASTLTSGTIFNMAYPAVTSLTGDLTGWSLDLNSGKVAPNNNSITGALITLATTTNTSGSSTLKGLVVNFGNGAGINQNSAGSLTYTAADLAMPALTQTQGTLTANGLLVTTPSSITTGGTASAINISPTGVGAGTLNGVNVGTITGGGGTETALNIGAGWDNVLKVNDTAIINGSGVTQVAGGGTGIASYAAGDLVYASDTTVLSKLAGGVGNNGKVLVVADGVPAWGTMAGSSCTDCVLNDPTSVATQTITPNNQDISSLVVRQTTYGTPTQDVFTVTSSDGNTKYFYVDKDGNVSTGGVSSQSITLTPASDTTALTLVGTNVTTQNLAYLNAHNTQGTIFNINYGANQTLTGTLTGQAVDFTNLGIGASNQSVTGTAITLPAVTNTNATGTKTYTGLSVAAASGLNQNGAGATEFDGVAVTIPALTQSSGTITGNGLLVTTPSSITTGGTANGLNIAASGVGAGTLNGINIGLISGGAGTETAIKIGSGWDNFIGGPNFIINGAGNVGIGTTDPAAPLHVVKLTGTSADLIARFISNSNDAPVTIEAPSGSATQLITKIDNVNEFLLYTLDAGTQFMTFPSGVTTSRMSIAEGGNIGIGPDTSPDYFFDVQGAMNVDSNAVIGGILSLANGTAAAPALNFTNLTNAGLWTNGDGLLLTTGGTNTSGLTVTGAGNVGVGTTAPAYKFQVSSGSNNLLLIGDDSSNNKWQIGDSAVSQPWIGSRLNGSGANSDRGIYLYAGHGAAPTHPYYTFTHEGVYSGSSNFQTISIAGTLVNNTNYTGRYTALSLSPSLTTGGSYTGLLVNVTETNVLGTSKVLMDLQTGGSSKFIVNSNGNVGIGTTTPGSTLSVIGNVGIGTSAAGAALQVNGGGLFGYGTSSTALSTGAVAAFNGNVGIGTTDPTALLSLLAATPELRLSTSTGGEYTRISRSSTSNTATQYNRVNKPADTPYGLSFDGGDYVSRAQTASLQITGDITIEAWIKSSNIGSGWNDIVKDPSAYYLQVYRAGSHTSYQILGILRVGGVEKQTKYTYGADLEDGNWHHLAYVVDKTESNGRLYVDGTLLTDMILNQDTSGITSTGTNLYIGQNGSSGEYFNGTMDEVRVSNSARYSANFTPQTAQFSDDSNTMGLWHMDEAAGTSLTDSSSYGNTMTLADPTATPSWVTGKGSASGNMIEAPIWSSEDGGVTGEEGMLTFGHSLGRTVLQGSTLRFNISDAEKMRIDTSGNLGIGTDTPLSKLGVLGNASIGGTYGAVAAPTNGLIVEGNIGIGTTSPGSTLAVSGNGVFGFGGATSIAGPSNGLAVSGNVGIGTTTANYNLSVVGTANISGALSAGSFTNSGQFLAANGTASLPSYSFSNLTNAGLWTNGDGLLLTTGGSDTSGLAITASGNVGIGTTNPSQKLDVNGNILMSGASPKLYLTDTSHYIANDSGNMVLYNSQDVVVNPGSSGSLRPYNDNAQTLGTTSFRWKSLQVGTSDSSFAGNVGIGTTNPTQKLHVVGNAIISNTTNPFIELYKSDATAKTWYLQYDPSGTAGFDIADANSSRLRITDSGNVGIGTTAPGAALDVNGVQINPTSGSKTILLPSVGGGAGIAANAFLSFYLDYDENSANTFFDWYNHGSTSPSKIMSLSEAGGLALGTYAGTDPGAGKLVVSGNVGIGTAAPLAAFQVNATASNPFVVQSGGNVGIGTTNPGALLHTLQLSSGATVTGLKLQNNVGDASTGVSIDLSNSSSGGVTGQISAVRTNSPVAGDSYLSFSSYSNSALREAMRINENGNVGIGFTSPNALLHIGGANQTTAAYGIQMGGDITLYRSASNTLKTDNNLVVGGTITSSGTQFLAANGTASLPSYSFSNLTNAGLWTNGDGLLLTTGGSDTSGITVTGAGNVGIGTTTPLGTLHLSSNTVTDLRLHEYVGSTSGPYMTFVKGRGTEASPTTLTTNDLMGGMEFYGYTGTTNRIGGSISFLAEDVTGDNLDGAIYFKTSTNNTQSEKMRITSTGNVGIGASLPTYTLDITKSGFPATLRVKDISTNYASLNINNFNDDGFAIQTFDRTYPAGSYYGTSRLGNSFMRVTPVDSFVIGTENASQLVLGTNNVARLTINSTGNVGIGFTSPAALLHVAGDARIGGTAVGDYLDITSTSKVLTLAQSNAGSTGHEFTLKTAGWGTDFFRFITGDTELMRIVSSGNVGIGTVSPVAQLDVRNTNSSTGLHTYIGSSAGQFGILDNGNVGIGTTNPGVKLEVRSTANGVNDSVFLSTFPATPAIGDGTSLTFNARVGAASDTFATGQILGITDNVSAGTYGGYLSFKTRTNGGSLTEQLRITGSGNVGIGTVAPLAAFQVNATASNPFVVQSGGNVGIGTTDPVTKLDVVGDIAFPAGNYIYTRTDSGNRLILHDAAGGNARWFTGGTERLTILNATGNIGIGITNPGSTLAVSGNGVFGFGGATSIAGPSNGLAVSGNVGIGTTDPTSKLTVVGDAEIRSGNSIILRPTDNSWDMDIKAVGAAGSTRLAIGQASFATEIMSLLYGGNVGIGTTNPTQVLQVVGTITSTGLITTSDSSAAFSLKGSSGTAIANMGVDSAGISYNVVTGKDHIWSVADSAKMRLFESGGLGLGGANYTAAAADPGAGNMVIQGNVGIGVTGPTYTLDVANSTDTNLLQLTDTGVVALQVKSLDLATNAIQINANGTNNLVFQTDGGNVGIGTTAPTNGKLEVAGDIYFGMNIARGQYFYGPAGLHTYFSSPSGYTTYIGNSSGTGGISIGNINGETLIQPTGGNVGIGTTDPGYKLEVNGTGYISGNITTPNYFIGGGLSLGYGQTVGIITTDDRSKPLDFFTQGDLITRAMRIDTTGNVGIGTTGPGTKLSIVKSGIESGNSLDVLRLISNDDPELRMIDSGNSTMGGFSADGSTFRMGSSSNIRFATGLGVTDAIWNGGTDRMTILSTGNVGIGTTGPTSLLNIIGSQPTAANPGTAATSVLSVIGGTGGNSSTAGSAGGVGGALGLATGAGGTSSATGTGTNIGGAGGAITLTTGAGGNAIADISAGATGGAGGDMTITLGTGGTGDYTGGGGSFYGGRGGNFSLTAGRGGQGHNIPGAGGSISLAGGEAGAVDYGTPNINGGNIYLIGGAKLNSGTNGNVLLTVNSSGTNRGNVGIGTTGPAYKLDIADLSSEDSSIQITTGVTMWDYSRLRLSHNGAGGGVISSVYSTSGPGGNNGQLDLNAAHSQGAGNNFITLSISGNEKFRLMHNGNVGIGTTGPGYLFQVQTSTNEGHVNSDGTWGSSSDIRLKNNITNFADGLNTVLAMNPVSFDFINEDPSLPGMGNHIGFIAQEMEQILPSVVSTDPNTSMKAIAYSQLTPVLVGAVQQQQSQLSAVSLQLSALTDKLVISEDGTLNVPAIKTGVITLDTNDVGTKISSLEDRMAALEASMSAQVTGNRQQTEATTASSLTPDASDLNLTPPDVLLATGSATLVNLNVTSEATVSGLLTAYDLNIQNGLKALGKTTLGETLIAGDLTVDGTMSIAGDSINAVSTLYLQNDLLSSSLDILNGAFIFDENGTLTVNGTVLASQFAVKSGTTAGVGTIPAGAIDAIIENEYVDENSVILITPHTPLNQTMGVADKVTGGFLVKLAHTEGSDIKFDYLIVGVKP